jgi:arylsulfatase A-like enzyme/tetratricopeptide (TPR) repeat protein
MTVTGCVWPPNRAGRSVNDTATHNTTIQNVRLTTMAPRCLWVLTLSLLTISCGRGEPAANGPAAPRAIVLITIDTLRADRVGVYGSPRGLTPALDRFATDSVRFDAAIAQVPLTLPSHATLLTGLRPTTHGVRTNDGFKLPDEVPTLAERLRAASYQTAAFVAAFPLRRSTGLARGFDHYDDAFLGTRQERRADEVFDAATSWLSDRTGARVFLWVHLFDPHTPYAAPSDVAARYASAPYDAEVAYTDREVGRFLETLRSLGVYDDSIIAIAADHGEALGDHGERTHGTFVYDSTVRVPLLIRMPGVAARTVADPVELTDVTPTLAAAARVRLPSSDGIDLRPLMSGAGGDLDRAAYTESYYQNVLLGWSPLRAVRTARWKFIDAPRPELYDLATDPGEHDNVASAQSRLAIGLSAALPPPVPAGSRASAPGADPADAGDRLRSLGYFSGRTASSAATGVDPKDRIELWGHLEDALELTPTDPSAAERALRKALAIEPSNGLALKYLGDLRYRTARYADAVAHYRASIDAGFEHPDAFLNLGSAALRTGDTRAAREALERGLEMDPEAGDAWNQLGTIHAGDGRFADARRAFDRALQLRDSDAEPRYNLALVARAEGRHDEATRLLAEAIARRPDYVEALVARGDLLLEQGHADAALASYRRALAARDTDLQAMFGAARAAATLGIQAEARRHYQRFLRLAPASLASHRAAARRELARLSTTAGVQNR